MRFIKRLLLILLILIILIAGAVFVLITFYKKDLTSLLIDELKTKNGLILEVKDIKVSFLDNWPHASIELKDVVLQSELNEGKSEPLLKAGSIALSFNLERMVHKEFIVKYVSIKDAEIALIKNPDGTKNFIFKKPENNTGPSKPSPQPAPQSTAAITFEVNKVTIKNTQFNYINRHREQNIDIYFSDTDIKLKHFTDGVQGRLRGEVKVGGLLFNANKGSFLAGKEAELDLRISFFKDTKTICVFPPSFAEIDNHRYDLTTLINLGENKRLALNVNTKGVEFAKASELLTAKLQNTMSNFEVGNTVNVNVLIVTKIGKKEDPALIVKFSGEHNTLAIGNSKIPYSDLSFEGSIVSLDTLNQRGDIEKARVIFKPVRGKLYQFPFTAAVQVVNLINPQIWIDGKLMIEGSKIDFKVAKDFILRGTTVAHLKYSGPTEKLNTREFLEKPMKLNADLVFENMSYQLINSPYVYVVNGKANMNNRDLKFDDLHLNSVVGEATIKGKAENFVNYILGYTNGFKANIAASTELLDLNPLFKQPTPEEQGMSKAEKAEKKKKDKKERRKKKDKDKEKKEKQLAQNVIAVSQFEFNVQLFAKKMLIRKVEAQFANADLHYKNNNLKIKTLNLNTCEGRFKAHGAIEEFSRIKLDISAYNVNVNKMFTQFENFNQEAITSDNLKGILSFDAKVRTELDPRMEIIGETMNGEVQLKLTNGHLINYEPVQNLSNILFRNRDFNDVSFSEINETFRLQGYRMEIEELEIASNVLDLFVVNGEYNFKGASNINILIPWSNLKRRGKNYIPKSSGQTAQNTKGVKLNFQGRAKEMKLSFGHKELSDAP